MTADRRWQQQAELFTRRGAAVLHGPTMRTIDLSGDDRLRSATEDLVARPPDVIVATTGAGLRLWLEAAEGWGLQIGLRSALASARLVARGAKAASAARGAGLDVWWQAPSEAMPEVVAHLRRHGLAEARVALQLFDPDDHPSTVALREAAGELVEVPVYRWLLPADTAPALAVVRAALDGDLAAVTFTSQPAVRHLFRIANNAGLAGPLRTALNGSVLPVCIGAVCAEAALEHGVDRPLWPEPPRLAAMVRLVTDRLT